MLENLIPMLSKLPPDVVSKAGGFMSIVSNVKTCWDIANRLKDSGGNADAVIQEAMRLSKGKLNPSHFGVAADIIEGAGLTSTCEKMSPGIINILRSIAKRKNFGGGGNGSFSLPTNNNMAISSRLKPLKTK